MEKYEDFKVATDEELAEALANIHREEGEIVINDEIIQVKIGDNIRLENYEESIFEITNINLVYDIFTLKPVYKIWVKWLNGESRPVNEKNIIEVIKKN